MKKIKDFLVFALYIKINKKPPQDLNMILTIIKILKENASEHFCDLGLYKKLPDTKVKVWKISRNSFSLQEVARTNSGWTWPLSGFSKLLRKTLLTKLPENGQWAQ